MRLTLFRSRPHGSIFPPFSVDVPEHIQGVLPIKVAAPFFNDFIPRIAKRRNDTVESRQLC